MSRSALNFLLDTLLLMAFCVLVVNSTIVQFVFPPGTTAATWRLWGLDYDQWATFQFATVATLALGFTLHVMLHWSWVCGFVVQRLGRTKKGKVDDGTQTLYGVGLLIVVFHLLGFVIAAAALMIRGPE